jgi:hypothetical protein
MGGLLAVAEGGIDGRDWPAAFAGDGEPGPGGGLGFACPG